MTQPLVVTVEHWDGQRHTLCGRAAFMAAILAGLVERINEAPRGTLTFSWEGPDLKPDLRVLFPHVRTDP